jgi:N-acetylmuramoyl-L-alanine amidase
MSIARVINEGGYALPWSYIRFNMRHVFTSRRAKLLALLGALLTVYFCAHRTLGGFLGRGSGTDGGLHDTVPVTGLAGKLVMLDPGHGGRDPGAEVGEYDEKDIVLAVGLALRDLLQEAGAVVVMTRDVDTDFSDPVPGKKKLSDLMYRIDLAHEVMPDVFLSIHANSFPASKWRGPQMFYNDVVDPSNRVLASFIQEEMSLAFDSDRKIVVDQRQFILKNLTMPAACVEIGFMTNPQDLALMTTPEGQRAIAWALCRGLARYFRHAPQPAWQPH